MGILNQLLKPFETSKRSEAVSPGSEILSKIENVLEDLPADQARNLAAIALILGRVAHADDEVSEGERTRMVEILSTHLGLNPAQAEAVSRLAFQREYCFSLDHHLVLRHLRETADPARRMEIARSLFQLAAVDEIDGRECEEIRVIMKGLQLTHSHYIALRSEFRDHLLLLKQLPE